MKKPFKETKFGKLLIEKVPDAVAVIGDVLPDSGVLGIAKNIIDKSTISKEEKDLLLKEAREFELNELQLILNDKQNARSREIEIAKAGGVDHLMYATGYTALGSFILMEVGVFFLPVEVTGTPTFHQLVGIIEGAALLVMGYYFGATMRDKDK